MEWRTSFSARVDAGGDVAEGTRAGLGEGADRLRERAAARSVRDAPGRTDEDAAEEGWASEQGLGGC